MGGVIDLFKALADTNRLRVVAALMERDELCACQISELLAVAGATTSRHMGLLLSAGLVESRKEGRWVYYRLCSERAEYAPLLTWLQEQLWQAAHNSARAEDTQRLVEIMALDPEELCRKQRGDNCCPR